MTGHGGWVNLLKLDADSNRILSGSYDHTVKMWDIPKHAKLHSLRGHKGSISCIEFLGDRNFILVGSFDNTISLWDLRHHKKWVQQFSGHTGMNLFHFFCLVFLKKKISWIRICNVSITKQKHTKICHWIT